MRSLFGSATAFNPGRFSKIEVDGIIISGDCLWHRTVPFPEGTALFLDARGGIHADPPILQSETPEVQFLGTVVRNGYILVTPRRLPVIL